MGKHTGQGKPVFHDAVDSAAAEALAREGDGIYVIDHIQVHVEKNPAAPPGQNPIRDYIVTLTKP
jgi:hypothetical protein